MEPVILHYDLPYDVRSFHGSHLELMLALEPLAGGVDKTQLVIHLPGFTEETVRSTPMLELYLAGVRYRKALDTLVTEAAAGRVRPEQIAAFAVGIDKQRQQGHSAKPDRGRPARMYCFRGD